MSIAIPINSAARARQLKAQHSYLTPKDIAETTGIPLKNVKAALKAKSGGKLKSRLRPR